jgi:hypothetical protein
LSRGRKIFVFRDIHELTYDCTAIVQEYITYPFLLFGHKFDMRIYVLVTSFQPLRVYMYRDMLVRFATEPYDLKKLTNTFAHLTNTSLNKYSPAYEDDKKGIGEGCKWDFPKLKETLSGMGIDFSAIWGRVDNIVLLTLLSIAPCIPPSCMPCFELYGFDIIIDRNLKPWLLEVNFSPALACEEPTDWIVKKPLIADMVDTLHFRPMDDDFIPPTLEDDVTRRMNSSNRTHPRNPTELTAILSQRAGNLVPYPLPRGFSRPVVEQTGGTDVHNKAGIAHQQHSHHVVKPRSQSMPPVRTLSAPLRRTSTTQKGASSSNRKNQKQPHVTNQLVDSAMGNFELIFPFNKIVEEQDISKGDSALRVIVNEIKQIELSLIKQCKHQVHQWQLETAPSAGLHESHERDLSAFHSP